MTEKFYNAVESDKDWELSFEVPGIKRGDKVYLDVHSIDSDSIREKETGKYYKIATHDKKKEVFSKVVKARKLMELIAKNMHQNAEPGVQNIDIARKYSNSDYMYDPKMNMILVFFQQMLVPNNILVVNLYVCWVL